MIQTIASEGGFLFMLLLFISGMAGSLLLRKDDALSNLWMSSFSITGSIWGILFAICTFINGQALAFTVGALPLPLLSLSFNVDKLSAFFIFVISLIALFCSVYGIGYVSHFYKKYSIGVLGFFYNSFILGMLLVVSSANGLFFLAAWELMSIASYFLVVYDRNDESNIKAGFLYLVMTQAGTALIIIAFLLLYKFTGSFDFAGIKAAASLIPLSVKNAVFILSLIGLGTKAGIVPFHIWLPSAHPAAPSHVSGLMSGVMIKTGIYMMIRMFLDILGPIPSWWGLVVLVLASISCLLGVLYALTEHDMKRLLAFHSIENIGIILLGLGSALVFTSMGMNSLALLGLTAALFHVLNHAIFKSLLFLGAGSVISQVHTRNMEEYGGLIRYMPQTALFFLVGSMAISALPPFNGFFSEWITFQALFQGIMSLDFIGKWVFVLSAGSLAFTGGLALACFVKAFGSIFLARARSSEVAHAKEVSFSLRFGMGALAVLALAFGIFSGSTVSVLDSVGSSLSIFRGVMPFTSIPSGQQIAIGNSFASVSGPAFIAFLISAVLIAILIVRYLINRNQKVTIGTTWDCGVDLNPRMEITSTGFARSIILIFQGILRPTFQKDVEYQDAKTRYLPKSRTITLGIFDVHQSYLYGPLRKAVEAISGRVKNIQSGNVNAYVMYIFIALVAALFSVL